MSHRRPCECDANDYKLRHDDGQIIDFKNFPIRSLHFGDNGDAREYARYTLGKLKCVSGKQIFQLIPYLYVFFAMLMVVMLALTTLKSSILTNCPQTNFEKSCKIWI